MPYYVPNPVVIEARQLTENNSSDICNWLGNNYLYMDHLPEPELFINTLEGVMKIKIGYYVIKGIAGEFYGCEPSIFEKKYKLMECDE